MAIILLYYFSYGPAGVINFTQPVYVRRDDPESRHNTIQEIIRRVKSDQDWPQVIEKINN